MKVIKTQTYRKPTQKGTKRLLEKYGDALVCVRYRYLETNIIPASENPRDNFGPVIVPKDAYFVMGDNRDRAYDSRFWGFVDKAKIKGTVKQIYWSWDRNGSIVRWNRIGKKIL
jgi:signal peptidase I